jgi:3-oxoadipate enol-lactonase
MLIAPLSDAQIHYDLRGSENLPTLVFSNSLGTALEMWNPQLPAFSPHFRILRYDTRGHGRSSVTPGDYSIAQLANDVVQLLDFLQLNRVSFCGLSMGGAIGMQLGLQAPQRFHKLVLCNTAAKFGTAETWQTRIQAVKAGGMKNVATSVVERWFTPPFREAHSVETQAVLAMLESANPQGYLSNCAAVRDFDFRDSLNAVRVPSLILTGTLDPVAPPGEAHFLADHIPGARYLEIPAAHLSNLEAPDEFNSGVLDFLIS